MDLDTGSMLFIVAVCVAAVIACTLCLACCSRIRHFLCGRSLVQSAKPSAKYTIAIVPFHRAYPIQLPQPEVDVEEPVVFTLLPYDKIVPVGRVYYKGSHIVFDAKRQHRPSITQDEAAKKAAKRARRGSIVVAAKPVVPSQSKTMTVQASRVLAGPSPDALSLSHAVYYEVAVDFLGKTKGGRSDDFRPVPSQLCIGWASFPYPPFELVGTAEFSLALHNNGRVLSNRASAREEDGVMLVPEGFAQGDVVGAGYELRRDAGVIEFFFTLNGRRLEPIPNDWGIFDLIKARRYYSAGAAAAKEEKKRKQRRRGKSKHKAKLGDHVLAGGAAYPTISSIGPAVVEPRMSPPFLYTPYMAMFGADPFRHKEAQTVGTKLAAERKRQAIVASVAGPGAAKSTTQAGALASAQAQGRRHSAITPAGMGNWNAFMHRNAADTAVKEQKEMEDALAALQADGGTGQKKRRRSLVGTKWSMGGPQAAAGGLDSAGAGNPTLAADLRGSLSLGEDGVPRPGTAGKPGKMSAEERLEAQQLAEAQELFDNFGKRKPIFTAENKERWRRRLSAPTQMVGAAVKGWTDRAAAIKVTRRTPAHLRVVAALGQGLRTIAKEREQEKELERLAAEAEANSDSSSGDEAKKLRKKRKAEAKARIKARQERRASQEQGKGKAKRRSKHKRRSSASTGRRGSDGETKSKPDTTWRRLSVTGQPWRRSSLPGAGDDGADDDDDDGIGVAVTALHASQRDDGGAPQPRRSGGRSALPPLS